MIERYTRPEMGRIWTLENKFRQWLQVEIFACEAWAELGKIPREAVERIRNKSRVRIDRILELEQTLNHDVLAFTTSISEELGEDGRHLHYGLTSSDVIDTALSALLVEAVDVLAAGLEGLSRVLARQAREHRRTPMIGRTHGVHAEPTTFGLKLALWYAEVNRHRERLRRAREAVAVGKISGAVGTYANVDPFVEQYVCDRLGLTRSPISTQILQRDRHAELVTTLAILASSLDKFATEIRALQKTEVREVEEPFGRGQKGSSAMPHKRNPITCERISGLARVVRSHALVSLENIPLWHERDISHSSAERVILPDVTILVDYMLHKFTWVLDNLDVYPGRMLRNLEGTGGLVYSQRVLLALVDAGMSREDAYRLVQDAAMRAWCEEGSFRRLLEEGTEVRQYLDPEALAACFDWESQLQDVDQIFARLGL